MATKHEIIGEEWKEQTSELAEWAMKYMVNRKDVWGQYSVLTPSERIKQDRRYKAMTLPRKDMRGEDMVTMDKLTRHFASRHYHRPQIIGLHAKRKESTSLWLGINIDLNSVAADAWRSRDKKKREFTWIRLKQQNEFRYDHTLVSPSFGHRIQRVRYNHQVCLSGISGHSLMILNSQ